MARIFVIDLADQQAAARYPTLFHIQHRRFAASKHTCDLLKSKRISFQIVEDVDAAPIEKQIVYPVKSFLYSTPEQGAVEEICAKLYASKREGALPHAIFLGRNINLEPGAFFLDKAGGHRNYQWKLTYAETPERRMAEEFPRFLHTVGDPDAKFVVSFGSGGLRLFSQPSMMKFINDIDARRFISEIWGCSGGSISGICYAMAVEPEAIEQKGYDIYNERFQFKLAPSALIVAKNTLVRAIFPSPPNLLEGYISVTDTMRSALSGLIAGQEFQVPFYCVAYNVRARRNEILTPLPIDPAPYGGLIVPTSPIDAVVASSSLPIIYVPKEIRRGRHTEHYIDGATAEPVPLLSIYRKWLIDREKGLEKRRKLVIFAIDPIPTKSKESWISRHILRKLPFADVARLGFGAFSLMMQARIHNQVEILRENKNVQVIMVSLPLASSSMLDIKTIPSIIQSAQTVLLEQMYEIEKTL
jgi:hypothetical protein